MEIRIGKIDTIPQYDPYRRTGQPSRTVIELEPARGLITVEQEYDTNSTTMDRWHGRVLTWIVNGHPQEETMREWLNAHVSQFVDICEGHTVEWNGNDYVGRMTEEAQDAEDAIDGDLFACPFDSELGWSLWDAEDWLQDMPKEWNPVGLSDGELESLVVEIEENARGDNVILYDTQRFLVELRDEDQRQYTA